MNLLYRSTIQELGNKYCNKYKEETLKRQRDLNAKESTIGSINHYNNILHMKNKHLDCENTTKEAQV